MPTHASLSLIEIEEEKEEENPLPPHSPIFYQSSNNSTQMAGHSEPEYFVKAQKSGRTVVKGAG